MITKLFSFSAEAEVMGVHREVAYDAGALTIRGLSLAEAYAVLAALSHGKLAPVDMPVPVVLAEKALGKPQLSALDDRIARAVKLSDVISALVDQGVTAPDDLVKRCLLLREGGHVLLSRVADLEQRVRTTASLIAKTPA